MKKHTTLTLLACTAALAIGASCGAVNTYAQADPSLKAGEIEPGLEGKNPELYQLYDLYDPNSSVWLRNPTLAGYRRVPDSLVNGWGRYLRYYPMRAPKEPLITWTQSFLSGPSVIGGTLDVLAKTSGYTSRGVLYHLMRDYVRSTERELEMYVLAQGGDTFSVYKALTGDYAVNAQRTKLIWKEGERKTLNSENMSKYSEIARIYTTFNSLIRDCEEISESEILPGDIYIALDTTKVNEGHLAIVLDVADRLPGSKQFVKGLDGKPADRLFLFGNCLTPATSFHIIKPLKPDKKNWFVSGELDKKLAGYDDGKFYRLPYDYLR